MLREIQIVIANESITLELAAIKAFGLKTLYPNTRVLFGQGNHAIPVRLHDKPEDLLSRWQDAQTLIAERSGPETILPADPNATPPNSQLASREGVNFERLPY
jgi:hypothetical protein